MTKKQEFVRFVQIYCSYLLKDDERISEQESLDLESEAVDFYKISAPYTCMSCGNRSGLSFIEKTHDCNNPLFDKNGIPIQERLIQECYLKGLDFELIKKSVSINRKHNEVKKQ